MENTTDETIDLKDVLRILWQRKMVVCAIVVGCTVVAILLALVLPKKYESTTLVQTRGTTMAMSGAAAAMAALSGTGVDSTTNYMELMKSRYVLDPIISDLDWWDDEKDIPKADKFAKQYLTIENQKKTNLITVTARGKTPEQAQYISQSVVDNFLTLQTQMNDQTQSLLLKFLTDRIATAKQEADEASSKFADFQKQHKVYSPTDQAKMIVSMTQAWDNAVGDLEVQQQAAQAQLNAVRAQIGDQESRSDAYQINDNKNVQSLRGSIVAKQVELVALRQKYTDNHPDVIAAEQALKKLQESLNQEVAAVVNSHTATMNPMHAKLVEQQVEGEVNLDVAKASEEAIKKRRDEKEKELGDFPQDVMEYMNLQREATIKETIYTTLVKQSEDARIKQAMESMDVQVVDSADLPREDKPAFPKKSIFAVAGCILGCLISLAYSLVIYKREGY